MRGAAVEEVRYYSMLSWIQGIGILIVFYVFSENICYL
jgi:hypothetical protein